MLMKNAQRQVRFGSLVKYPPKTGPRTAAAPAVAPHIPKATFRALPVKVVVRIARESLKTSIMRSCFRSILVDPPTGAVPAGPAPSHFWSEGLLSPDIEMPSHLFGVIKHSRQRDAPQLLNCETSKNSSGKASSQFAKGPSHRPL